MSKVVIFGIGVIADLVYAHLTHDSPHEVVAFAVDEAYRTRDELYGLPVVDFETVQDRFPPAEFRMFVAVGYQDLNRFRARKYDEAKARGYELITYVSSQASNVSGAPIGDNCFVLENAVIQACSRVGNNVFVGGGSHVGHHATVGDHCYLTGQAVISGNTTLGSHCFVGVNATIGHELSIGDGSFVGAGTLVTKSAPAKSVFIAPDTPKFRLDADQFLALTKMK